ncbi:MAG: hypothetical protein OSJ66_06370 [Clostridia bacterium]|nr:hypothetical protein [Clostridia bacterium]
MEHANKAFIMAAGMLFALMILSLVAFVFGRLTSLPVEEDVNLEASQIAAFNNEYTAYDKKIMYGVDIISVLNKAKSNNDKYVQELFVAGGGYNTDFVIDIQVTLKHSNLEESMVVSFIQQTNRGVSEVDYTGAINMNSQLGPYKDESHQYYYKLSEISQLKAPSENYQDMVYPSGTKWNNLEFKTQTISTNVAPGTYHIIGADGENPDPNDSVTTKNRQLKEDNTLKQLLSQSTVMSQTIKNRSDDTFYPFGWSQAVWKPATYDLKTRKFRCVSDETIISEKTGRIVKMVFEEI